MLELLARGRKIAAKMPAPEAPKEISQPVQQKQPGKEEVPAPPDGEVALTGKRRPPRKPAHVISAAGIAGEPQHARGVEVQAEHCGDAVDLVALLHRPHGEDRAVEIRFRAEIKRGMGVEDLQAAHQEHQQHERVDPMGEAHRARMPIDDLALLHDG